VAQFSMENPKRRCQINRHDPCDVDARADAGTEGEV
jgi:hypothetical protein